MLNSFNLDRTFIAYGYTRGIDALATIVQEQFKLDPYRYLTYVLGLAPNLEQEDDKWIEQLLPENASENCKANYRGK